jgi:serine phosphatase RsbU (regulator of sigma subunit)
VSVSSPLDAHLVSDEAGTIREADPAATLLLGVAPRFVRGKPLAAFVAPATRRRFRRELLALVREHSSRAFVVAIVPRGAPERDVQITGASVEGGRGGRASVHWTLRSHALPGLVVPPPEPAPPPAPRKPRARRDALIARVSAPAAAGEEPVQALGRLARACVPAIADWACLELVQGDELRQVAAVARSGPFEPLGRPLRMGEDVLLPAAPTRYAPVPAWLLHRLARTAEQRALLTAIAPGSALVVPLRAGSARIGALILASSGTRRILSVHDERLVHELAERAVLIAENARLYAEHLDTAVRLQRSLLPPALPLLEGLDLAARLHPAHHGGVAGDFYDAWSAPTGATVLAVGDVAGKGLDAAVVATQVRHSLRAASISEHSPAAMLRVASETLRQEAPHPERYCTAVVAVLDVLDEGTLAVRLARAGHPYPLALRPRGTPRVLRPAGGPLGIAEEPVFEELRAMLVSGEGLLLYTDGVTEAVRGRDRFGLERLVAVASTAGLGTAEELIALVERRVASFGDTSGDDVTLLAARAG